MKHLKLLTLLIGSSLALNGHAQNQRVSIDASSSTLSPEESGQLSILYESDNGLLATGIGFTVHFDSSQVQLNSIDNLFHRSKIGVQILSDDEDLDHNPDTDSYVTAGWANINGGWPDTVIQPVKLFDLNIRVHQQLETMLES